MKIKRFLCIVLIVILIIPRPMEVYSATSSYFVTTFTASDTKIGDARLRLKKGFDFVETDSSHYNYELALTAATLSAQVYPAANGDTAKEILKKIGFDKCLERPTSFVNFPVVSYAYRQLEEGKNVFAVVVRGTTDWNDYFTNISGLSMFEQPGIFIAAEMCSLMEELTGKTLEEIKKEDNYFFFTGHSLGGAVANYMSINKYIMDLVNSDKEKIYTYTFESPHTCEGYFWMHTDSMSNAFNFKVVGDAVTNLPPYTWSTTYGKDVPIKASELNDDTLRTLFVNSKINSIDGNIGLHDTCLPLIYILDMAKKRGNDISWVFYEPDKPIVFTTDSIKYLGTEFDKLRKEFPNGKLEHSSGSAPWVWSSSDSDISFQFWGGPGNNQCDNWYNWTSGPYPEPYGDALCHTIMSDAGNIFSGLYDPVSADEFISRLTLDEQYSLADNNSIQTSAHHHAWSLSAKDGIGYVSAAHNVCTDNANVTPEAARWTLKNAEWEKTESENITKSEGEQLWDEYYGNGEILFFDPVQ